MAAYSSLALRVPASLIDDLRTAADRDGVSLNSFIVQAVAKKVAVLRTRGLLDGLTPAEQLDYLDGRAARALPGRMAELLAKAGTTEAVRPGDEVPDGILSP